MKKKEKLFILSILLIAGLLWLVLQLFGSRDYGQIKISVDGDVFGTWSLSENQVISIHDTNICEIKDGKVRMTDATCPDHLCISQGAVDARGGMIVCLPNKVVIEGIKENSSSDDTGIDAVS